MANLFEDALAAEGITGKLADVARSIYQQESGSGKNTKTSNAGAKGGMQIIPSTFNSVADKGWDINDPLHNARAGARYVAQMFKQAGGDPALTAAGYYGGPGGMEKARRGIAVSDPRNPNAPNTLQYAQQVASRIPGSSRVQEALPVEAPVQLAPAPTPTTVAYRDVAPPAPVRSMADDVAEWNQLQQAMPQEQPVRVADLNYGQFNAPQMAMPRVNIQPNFQAFSKWKGRV